MIGCTSASSSESLAESKHPYANNSTYTWTNISEPGATEIRLHFSDLDIGNYDKLIILDKYENDLVTYSDITKADFWTEWYAGDTLGVRLITSDQGTGYGFKIDKGETKNDKNVTTTFSGSNKVNTEISRSKPEKSEDSESSGEDSEKSQNPTVNSEYIHNQFVKIAVTLNILEEDDDQSWMYKNIQWVFSGVGVSFIGAIFGLVKKSKDKKLEDKKSEDDKPEDKKS